MPSQSGTSSSARTPRSPHTGDSPRCRGRCRARTGRCPRPRGPRPRSGAATTRFLCASGSGPRRTPHPSPDQVPRQSRSARPRLSIGRTPRRRGDARFAGEARQPRVRSHHPHATELVVPGVGDGSALAPASPARRAGGEPRRARTRAAPAAGARRRTARARAPSWEDALADLVGVGGDLPAEAVGVGEVAGVAAPVAALALAGLGADRRRERQDLVDLGFGGARCAPA